MSAPRMTDERWEELLEHEHDLGPEDAARAIREGHRARESEALLLKALGVALAAMQANIAYASRKDEHALARGIEAAHAAIAKAEESEAPDA